MGALSYQPEYDKEPIEDAVNLSALAASVESVLSGSTQEVFTQLRIQGGSPGGARPKSPWLWPNRHPIVYPGFMKFQMAKKLRVHPWEQGVGVVACI
jgi:hypothetical protein